MEVKEEGNEEVVLRSRRARGVAIRGEQDVSESALNLKAELEAELKNLMGGKGIWDSDATLSAYLEIRQQEMEDEIHRAEDPGETESDDSDWDYLLKGRRWSCVNCTAPNVEGEGILCTVCGEHKNSVVLENGFCASAGEGAAAVSEAAAGAPKDAEVAVLPLLEGYTSGGAEGKVPGPQSTIVGFDERMLLHEETRATVHPERPNRLRAILGGFRAAGLFPGRCAGFPAREVSRKELEQVHTGEHVDLVELTASQEETVHFTSDTYANQHSAVAARLAAGTTADMAVAIATGKAKNGIALVRPPGHHAEGHAIMGFCLHNNAAVAARAAQAAGAKRVLIVDWDVHHGNGIQEIFESDPSVLYISLHRFEGGLFYPGTGAASKVGTGDGIGYSVNVAWPCGGIGDADYVAAFLHVVLPIAYQFAPDVTLVSAGFDAARGDPLGGCDVTPSGYAQMTSLLMALAGGRLLVVLEGGYNLRSISASAAAVVTALLGDPPPALSHGAACPTPAGLSAIMETCTMLAPYWPGLALPLVPSAPTVSPVLLSKAEANGNHFEPSSSDEIDGCADLGGMKVAPAGTTESHQLADQGLRADRTARKRKRPLLAGSRESAWWHCGRRRRLVDMWRAACGPHQNRSRPFKRAAVADLVASSSNEESPPSL